MAYPNFTQCATAYLHRSTLHLRRWLLGGDTLRGFVERCPLLQLLTTRARCVLLCYKMAQCAAAVGHVAGHVTQQEVAKPLFDSSTMCELSAS